MGVEEYVRERNDALRALDEVRIRELARKAGVEMPEDEEVFWGAVHKCRLALSCFTPGEQEVSRRWLREHGFGEKVLWATKSLTF